MFQHGRRRQPTLCAEHVELGQIGGCADQAHILSVHIQGMLPGKGRCTIPKGRVRLSLARRAEARELHIHMRMALGKARETRQEPPVAEDWQRVKPQDMIVTRQPGDLQCGILHGLDGQPRLPHVDLPRRAQPQAGRIPQEKGRADPLLQLCQLLAHSALGQVHHIGRRNGRAAFGKRQQNLE
uniref:E3 ubiquitin-protein ligase TRIM36 n=1 Tax=Aureimonas frigidaquae TaxID=424757 RepID=A0A0P0Z3E4_9HYPH|nr:E3 ubiquitin-protein ligase TRIM36 [Aureimonas frigidaquae]